VERQAGKKDEQSMKREKGCGKGGYVGGLTAESGKETKSMGKRKQVPKRSWSGVNSREGGEVSNRRGRKTSIKCG